MNGREGEERVGNSGIRTCGLCPRAQELRVILTVLYPLLPPPLRVSSARYSLLSIVLYSYLYYWAELPFFRQLYHLLGCCDSSTLLTGNNHYFFLFKMINLTPGPYETLGDGRPGPDSWGEYGLASLGNGSLALKCRWDMLEAGFWMTVVLGLGRGMVGIFVATDIG